ncbi:MAG TPA: DUF2892 domain-containing protein [Prolixibacteraceae bacterium]|jgi:uncharacterized membrane protein
MKKNMGVIDKTIRVIVAAVIALLYYLGIISGTLAIVLMIFAIIFIVTSIVGFCPVYPILGMNTRKKEEAS